MSSFKPSIINSFKLVSFFSACLAPCGLQNTLQEGNKKMKMNVRSLFARPDFESVPVQFDLIRIFFRRIPYHFEVELVNGLDPNVSWRSRNPFYGTETNILLQKLDGKLPLKYASFTYLGPRGSKI